jgi:hypothetical protein
MRRPLAALAFAAFLVLGLVFPVAAKPLVREHYSGTDTFTAEFCGTTWNAEITFEGLFMLKEGRAGNPTPFFFDNYHYEIVWTDSSEPSRSWVQTGQGLFKDLRITLVSGTVYDFQALETGQPFVMWTTDGELIVRDRGSIVHHFRVDTKGDDLDNDEFIEGFDALRISGPHPVFLATEEEFCGFVADAVGD